jgi:P2-related tail formation protein
MDERDPEAPAKTVPDRTEATEYYFRYINQVPDGDICEILEAQSAETLALLRRISDAQSLHRYAADKWSMREVLSHMNDTERVFVFRAFWFARGFVSTLPSFDQDIAVSAAGADARSWTSHVDEFREVRAATLAFFLNLPPQGWLQRGVASENPFTVRALAYIIAGHVAHHTAILWERYLPHFGNL